MINWDDYEDVEESSTTTKTLSPGTPPLKPQSTTIWNEFPDFQETPQEALKKDPIAQQYAIEEKTPSELKRMSTLERYQYMQDLKTQREYLQSAGITKGALSDFTLGASEKIPGLKPQKHELNEGFGRILGTTARDLTAFKFLKLIAPAGNILRPETLAFYGGGIEAGKQYIKGEGFDKEEIAKQAAFFGALTSAIELIPGAYQWLKSLLPTQRAKVTLEGLIPPDLTENQMRIFEQEIGPELRANAEKSFLEAQNKSIVDNDQKYKQMLANTKAQYELESQQLENKFKIDKQNVEQKNFEYENQLKNTKSEHENKIREIEEKYGKDSKQYNDEKNNYKNKLNNVKSEHENKMIEIEEKFQQDSENYEKNKFEYQNKLNNIKSEHETEWKRITEENEQAVREYTEHMSAYEDQVLKQEQELANVKSVETAELPGTGLRKSPTSREDPSLQNKIGNVLSDVEIQNSTKAGEDISSQIHNQAESDYREVNKAYDLSEKAHSKTEAIHPNLAQEIQLEISELEQLGYLADPSQARLKSLKDVLKMIAEVGPDGKITGFKMVNNQKLLEQAKQLRQKIDYDFAQGSPNNVFLPDIQRLQKAATNAAQQAGNMEAIELEKTAR